MTRMVMPDSACRQIEVEGPTGRRYTTGRNGTFTVTNPTHERRLREIGAFPANVGGTPTMSGYRCTACSFSAFFTTCGRCGATCERETS